MNPLGIWIAHQFCFFWGDYLLGGKFDKSEIAEFVFANKLPLVTIFTRESAPLIFESPIKKQVVRSIPTRSINVVIGMRF